MSNQPTNKRTEIDPRIQMWINRFATYIALAVFVVFIGSFTLFLAWNLALTPWGVAFLGFGQAVGLVLLAALVLAVVYIVLDWAKDGGGGE